MQEPDKLRRIRLEELRREIAKGIEAADRGELVPGKQVFKELRERTEEIAKQRDTPSDSR